MNCCNDFDQCTQGHGCPVRPQVVTQAGCSSGWIHPDDRTPLLIISMVCTFTIGFVVGSTIHHWPSWLI